MQLCRQFEEAFAKSVDGGKGGGEQILTVFERRLTENIRQLEFRKILEPQNVKRIVEEADGYQPHLIAPEMGYRRLLQARLAVALPAPPTGSWPACVALPLRLPCLLSPHPHNPVTACQQRSSQQSSDSMPAAWQHKCAACLPFACVAVVVHVPCLTPGLWQLR